MIKKLNHPLAGNFLSLLALQGVNYILPLITVPYLFRVLNVETYGLINFATAFIQYFIVFTDFGYNLSATKLVAEEVSKNGDVSKVFNRVMCSKILLLLVSFLVLLFIIFTFGKFSDHKMLYLYSFGMAVGNVLFPVWFFLGMEKMKFITIITIVTRVLSLAPIFIFVHAADDYLLVPVINSGGAILSGIISLWVVMSIFKIRFYVPPLQEIIASLKHSSHFFASRVSVSLYTVSNSFVLGLFGTNTMVGYYSAAEKLFIAIQSAYIPVNNSLYPYMTKTKNVPLFKKILLYVTILNVAGICVLLFVTAPVVYLIYGITDAESVLTLKLLLIACLVIVPSILLGYPFLGALGYSKYTNQSVIISSLFHLAGLAALVITGTLSIYAVAGMVIITETIVLSIRLWGVRKYKLFSLPATAS